MSEMGFDDPSTPMIEKWVRHIIDLDLEEFERPHDRPIISCADTEQIARALMDAHVSMTTPMEDHEVRKMIEAVFNEAEDFRRIYMRELSASVREHGQWSLDELPPLPGPRFTLHTDEDGKLHVRNHEFEEDWAAEWEQQRAEMFGEDDDEHGGPSHDTRDQEGGE